MSDDGANGAWLVDRLLRLSAQSGEQADEFRGDGANDRWLAEFCAGAAAAYEHAARMSAHYHGLDIDTEAEEPDT